LTVDAAARSAKQAELGGYLAALFAAAAWGTSSVFVKLIAAEVEASALALAFWPDARTFAVLFGALALFRRSWLRVDRRDLGWLVGLGASLGLFHAVWTMGVLVNGAAVATV